MPADEGGLSYLACGKDGRGAAFTSDIRTVAVKTASSEADIADRGLPFPVRAPYSSLIANLVTMAAGLHPFPSRTRSLSPPAPMVLHSMWESRSSPGFF